MHMYLLVKRAVAYSQRIPLAATIRDAFDFNKVRLTATNKLRIACTFTHIPFFHLRSNTSNQTMKSGNRKSATIAIVSHNTAHVPK